MKARIEGKLIDFKVIPQSTVRPGDLCLVSIGHKLVIGHYCQDANGAGWLVRHDRAIKLENEKKSR